MSSVKYFTSCYALSHNVFIREIKFDVTWPYVKRQTAKMNSEFVFFSSNPSLNHIKIEKCLLLIATNTNIFTLLFNELKTDGKSFIFAVCRLTYDHVTSNLISLVMQTLDFVSGLHNCLEFSQPLSRFYQAMQPRKTFSIALIGIDFNLSFHT